jgi:hypothetical protein
MKLLPMKPQPPVTTKRTMNILSVILPVGVERGYGNRQRLPKNEKMSRRGTIDLGSLHFPRRYRPDAGKVKKDT